MTARYDLGNREGLPKYQYLLVAFVVLSAMVFLRLEAVFPQSAPLPQNLM